MGLTAADTCVACCRAHVEGKLKAEIIQDPERCVCLSDCAAPWEC